jgi:hypothetical protein
LFIYTLSSESSGQLQSQQEYQQQQKDDTRTKQTQKENVISFDCLYLNAVSKKYL